MSFVKFICRGAGEFSEPAGGCRGERREVAVVAPGERSEHGATTAGERRGAAGRAAAYSYITIVKRPKYVI